MATRLTAVSGSEMEYWAARLTFNPTPSRLMSSCPWWFTTGSWAFSDWPFGGLQLGRLREFGLSASRRLESLGLPRLYDGARLRVETARAMPGRTGISFGEGAPGFGLFVKVAWNALLIGADAEVPALAAEPVDESTTGGTGAAEGEAGGC